MGALPSIQLSGFSRLPRQRRDALRPQCLNTELANPHTPLADCYLLRIPDAAEDRTATWERERLLRFTSRGGPLDAPTS